MTTPIYECIDWGLIEYNEALKRQLELAELTAENNMTGTIVFCTHPEIVTLGSKSRPDDITTWNGPTAKISRGGRATYHGPSQLVVYPIINLNLTAPNRPAQDIHIFLRQFENAIVNTLKIIDVHAQGRSLQKNSTSSAEGDETGVWVNNLKIASLGIQVKRWVTLHGAAINLDQDESAFRGIKPCGFQPERMVSAQKIIGKKIDRVKFQSHLLSELLVAI